MLSFRGIIPLSFVLRTGFGETGRRREHQVRPEEPGEDAATRRRRRGDGSGAGGVVPAGQGGDGGGGAFFLITRSRDTAGYVAEQVRARASQLGLPTVDTIIPVSWNGDETRTIK